MLSSLIPRLLCPVCRDRSTVLQANAASETSDGHIAEGELTCPACRASYPIRGELLELVVPALRDDAPTDQPQRHAFDAQLKQREHFDWFAEEAPADYDAYQQTPFWRAADRAAFARWRPRVSPNDWMLDVGSANGRSAWPLAGTGATIIGCDISRKLIAQAIAHSRRNGTHARTTFLVADADTLPFRDATFDIVLTYGALHHLPDPARACRDIQRIVRPGGVHLGSENNKTALRPLFDLLMKVKQLWVEEAGEQPLISESMIRQWTAGSQPRVSCRTSVFVPPHLVNLLGERLGGALLDMTDALGRALPFVRASGGLLVFEIERRGLAVSERQRVEGSHA